MPESPLPEQPKRTLFRECLPVNALLSDGRLARSILDTKREPVDALRLSLSGRPASQYEASFEETAALPAIGQSIRMGLPL